MEAVFLPSFVSYSFHVDDFICLHFHKHTSHRNSETQILFSDKYFNGLLGFNHTYSRNTYIGYNIPSTQRSNMLYIYLLAPVNQTIHVRDKE